MRKTESNWQIGDVTRFLVYAHSAFNITVYYPHLVCLVINLNPQCVHQVQD